MTGQELTLAAALLAGLVGSAHCLGMCGGIAMLLGGRSERGTSRALAYTALYNLGRIASYAIAGALAGGLGLWLGSALAPGVWAGVLRAVLGAVMVAIGLQIALSWRLLRHVEALGLRVWQRLSPVAARLLSRRSPAAALALGMLWGWLPCGLVYVMLSAAAVSGGPLHGSGLMLAFGLGTMPALIATGAAGARLSRLQHSLGVRRVAGALVAVAGVWTAAMPLTRWMQAIAAS